MSVFVRVSIIKNYYALYIEYIVFVSKKSLIIKMSVSSSDGEYLCAVCCTRCSILATLEQSVLFGGGQVQTNTTLKNKPASLFTKVYAKPFYKQF